MNTLKKYLLTQDRAIIKEHWQTFLNIIHNIQVDKNRQIEHGLQNACKKKNTL